MDKTTIYVKIESLERCVDRVISKVPAHRHDLSDDLDRQDIIVLNLQRAVQLSVDIAARLVAELKQPAPMSMAQSFEMLFQAGIIDADIAERMQKSVGFRNIAVHEYRLVDWDVVYSIATKHLSDFNKYARQVMNWLDHQ
nr:DUF86 domain-containing protein [Desulfobulbaceae bacterium]